MSRPEDFSPKGGVVPLFAGTAVATVVSMDVVVVKGGGGVVGRLAKVVSRVVRYAIVNSRLGQSMIT